jgi:hypothetical protein
MKKNFKLSVKQVQTLVAASAPTNGKAYLMVPAARPWSRNRWESQARQRQLRQEQPPHPTDLRRRRGGINRPRQAWLRVRRFPSGTELIAMLMRRVLALFTRRDRQPLTTI